MLYCVAAKPFPLKAVVCYLSVTLFKLESWRKGCKRFFSGCTETWEEDGRVPASFQAPQHHFRMRPKSLNPAQMDATQALPYRLFQNVCSKEIHLLCSSQIPRSSGGTLQSQTCPRGERQATGGWKGSILLSALLTQICWRLSGMGQGARPYNSPKRILMQRQAPLLSGVASSAGRKLPHLDSNAGTSPVEHGSPLQHFGA